MATDPFMAAAIAEAEAGRREGGIPIGSVLVSNGRILGRGHNRRVQRGSVVLHGEMDALENAGRQPAAVYRESVLYTTLSPCPMCTGAILLYGIPTVIVPPRFLAAARRGRTSPGPATAPAPRPARKARRVTRGVMAVSPLP